MPKAATYLLAWSASQQSYTLAERAHHEILHIVPESHAWFAWLDEALSFTFQGQAGSYTARKETNRSGEGYWYAYVRSGEKLLKKYVGRTTEVTLARLEDVAGALSSERDSRLQARHNATLHEGSSPDTGRALQAPNVQLASLLATKLHQPRPRAQLVPRSHLVERLQQGMQSALTLVSAPAGFGKTTLLAQWLAESDIPVAWLSLEAEDNDPVRFLTYVIAALQTVDAHVGVTILDLMHSPQPPPPETLVTLLTNDLLRSEVHDFALVLDDYHVIEAPPLHRALTALVEHLPPQLHLVLVTRADPPLPLARLRARGQLIEVRSNDLRFSAQEASAFLRSIMTVDLSPEQIDALERRTEGWIAGLQLAALAMRGRADVSGFLAAFTGSHRFVLDYLSEEVLARQPTLVQSFLLHTSVLSRLSGSLCDAVTGQEGSQAMLEALERANLFVIALDDERRWYLYHHLFAEMLRSHLQQQAPTLLPQLNRRASAWYEQNALPLEAVQHALAIPDGELAARLIEPIVFSVTLQGQISTVLGWIDTLPESLVRTRPALCVSHAISLLFTNQSEAARDRLQEAERGVQEMPAEQARIIQGWVLTNRGSLALLSGDIPQAVFLARQALEVLPEAEVLPRAWCRAITIRSYLVSGDVTPATEREVTAAEAFIRTSDNLFSTVSSISLLARLHVLQCRLRLAANTYRQVMQAVPQPEILQTLFTSLSYYYGLGDLLREWNDLEAAEQHLTQGMAMINETLYVEPFVAVLGYTTLARLEMAQGNLRAAFATLDALAYLAELRHFAPHLLTQREAVRAQLELVQGNVAAPVRWAEASGLSATDEDLPYPREGEYLALARVRIAQARNHPAGSFLQDALHLLERLLRDAEAKARLGSMLEILVLQALTLEAQGDSTSALSTLERALVLAEPEGYIRLFIDEGRPMQALLRQIRPHVHGNVQGYVTRLLSAFGGQPASSEPGSSSLAEPLTEREREVLRLLLTGASNREIAHRLVLSINTVKRHIYNLCGKMGVQSRSQAIVKARSLDLR